MNHPCLLFFFLFLFLATATTPTTSRLLPRRVPTQSYDPYIICEGYGPNHTEGLPTAYDEDVYITSLAVCSAAHGARQNIGCACTEDNRHALYCDEHIADGTLWNAVFKSTDPDDVDIAIRQGFENGEIPFEEYCYEQCWCADPETAYQAMETIQDPSVSTSAGVDGRVPPAGDYSGTAASVRTNSGNSFGAGAIEGTTQAQGQPAVQNQCGNTCKTGNDCQNPAAAKGNSSCTCRTQSSQFQPGAGTVAFVAACLINMASPGGKRDEEWPCPCNGSYVSHGCCGASGGMVWEAVEFKLGELVTEEL